MARVTELLIGPEGSIDTENKADAKRRFEIIVYNEQAALTDSGIPAVGTAHPNNGALILDRKAATQREDGTFLVDCLYSNYQRFANGKIDKKSDSYLRWSFSRKTVRQKIPYATIQRTTTPRPNGGVDQTDAWTAREAREVDEQRVYINGEVTVPKITLGQMIQITNQIGKLHKFPAYGQRQFRFSASDPTPITETKDNITYTWEIDFGTVAPFSPDPFKITLPPAIPGTNFLCRRPFEGIVMIQAALLTTPPTFTSVSQYAADDTGYVGLPGMPIT